MSEVPFLPCGVFNATVFLDGPDRSYTTVTSGAFEFENIPSGEYILEVVPACSPFGCHLRTTVRVPEQVEVIVPFRPICVGDCSDRSQVDVANLVKCVAVVLGATPLNDCLACDANLDGSVTIDDLIVVITNTLEGCG